MDKEGDTMAQVEGTNMGKEEAEVIVKEEGID